MRKEGVAVLKPGQYRGSHKIRLHAGKYPALGQQRNVTVYRDNNKDGKFDLDDDRGEEEEERGKRGCILLTAMH